jgi:hypothetical protein
MAVVKEYIKDNCRIRIHDDSMVRTKEESDKIIKDIDQACSRYFSNNIEKLGQRSGLKTVE